MDTESFGYNDIPFKPLKYKKRNRTEYYRVYRQVNKERMYIQRKEYYRKNISKIRMYQRECYSRLTKEQRKQKDQWRKKNRLKYNLNMRRYYYRNKDKFNSRIATIRYITGRIVGKKKKLVYKKIDGPENICQQCKATEGLQIHHEIYPTRKKEIIKAIAKKRIYYLCKVCHGR